MGPPHPIAIKHISLDRSFLIGITFVMTALFSQLSIYKYMTTQSFRKKYNITLLLRLLFLFYGNILFRKLTRPDACLSAPGYGTGWVEFNASAIFLNDITLDDP